MAKKTIILDKEGKDTGQAVGPDEGYAAWLARQAAIGLTDTPGTFATLYGLAGAGKDYLLSGSDDTRSYKEHLLDPAGGKEKLDKYNEGVIEHIRTRNPDLTPEEVEKKFDYIQKHSKKYFKDTSDFMRPGVSFGRRWGVANQNAWGDPRIPTERTMGDDIANIVGGSAPVPGVGTLAKASGSVGAKVASKMATNAPLRYTANVVEAVTPATIIPPGASAAGIAGRVGANIGIGTTLNQGVRAYEGNPSVFGDPTEKPAQEVAKKDDGSGDIAAIGATGAIATILGARYLKRITKGTPQAPSAGPAREAMEEVAHPEPNLAITQLGSEIEPIRKMAKSAGLAAEDVQMLHDEIQRVTGPMAKADSDNWVATRLKPLYDKYSMEDPEFQTRFWQHIADRNRIYKEIEDFKDVNDDIAKATRELASAQNARRAPAGTPAAQARSNKIAAAQVRLRDLQAEKQLRIADTDAGLRPMMMNDTRATVQARLQQSKNDPKVRALELELQKRYDDVIDVNVNEGIISAAAGRTEKQKVRLGNYSLGENPLTKKGWLDRKKAAAVKDLEDHLVFAHTDGALALYRGVRNGNKRKGYLDVNGDVKYVNRQPNWVPESRTNNPANPFDELQYMSVRTRQAAFANRAMKKYFTAMNNSPGNISGRLVRQYGERIPERQVPYRIANVLEALSKKHGPYRNAYYDNGDLVIMEHNSRVIRDLFKFSPASVVPVLNGSRKLFQAITTGAVNPTWALIGMPWDVMMGTLFRNKNIAFGPISQLANSALGRGSFLARYISAIASPADLVANMIKMPFVAVKSILSEIVGNQLAHRWQAQIATNSGVIGTIAKMPGGQQLVQNVVDSMTKAYDTSWTNMTKMYRVGHVSSYSDELVDHMRKVDAISKSYPMYKTAFNSYRSILSVLHDVPKQMMLSQNLKLYKKELARGRQMKKFVTEDFIANEARMIGGDLARVSGNKYLQGVLSTVPYGNVALQSVRYTAQRVKENGVEGMARLASLGMAVGWLYQYVSSDPKWADWYFNQLTSEQRMQSLPIPNPIRHMRRMFGEKLPEVDPSQEFFLLRMPPEMLPFFVPIMHGMMALGWVDSSKAAVPPIIKQDFKQGVDQIFGLGLPPLIQAIAASQGKKVEPSKLLTGDSMFRDIRDVSFSGANKDKMSPQSRIPHAYHDVFNALFGTVAGTIFDAANYADIVAERKGSFKEGVIEGAKKFAAERTARVPYAHHLWPDINRRYIYTPYTQKTQEDMSLLRKVHDQWAAEPAREEFGKGGGQPNQLEEISDAGGAVGAPVDDPDLEELLIDIHENFFTGDMLELQKERTRARRIHESYTVGPAPKGVNESPLTRFKKAQAQAKEVNNLDLEIHNLYQDSWREMATSPSGKAFEMKYGPLTPENLLKAVQASATRSGRQP